MDYKIIPGTGFDFIKINDTTEQLKMVLGEPDKIEILDDEEFFDDVHEAIWHYNDHCIYPVVNMDKQTIVSILSDHPDLYLKKAKVMTMNVVDLIEHLKSSGIKKMDREEDCIECYDDGVTFMFEQGKIDLVDIFVPER